MNLMFTKITFLASFARFMCLISSSLSHPSYHDPSINSLCLPPSYVSLPSISPTPFPLLVQHTHTHTHPGSRVQANPSHSSPAGLLTSSTTVRRTVRDFTLSSPSPLLIPLRKERHAFNKVGSSIIRFG